MIMRKAVIEIIFNLKNDKLKKKYNKFYKTKISTKTKLKISLNPLK